MSLCPLSGLASVDTQGGVQLSFEGKLRFKNGGAPLEKDNFAFCKVMLFHIKSTQQKEEHNF